MGHFTEQYVRRGLEFYKRLIACSALERIEVELLRQLARGGIVGFKCADGKYTGEIVDHIRQFTEEPHFLSLNGTALLLLPDREEFAEDRRVLYRHAREAWAELQKGTAIMPLTHFPCGKALKHGIDPAENVIRTYNGAADIARELSVPRRLIVPAIHIHWNAVEHANGDAKKFCRTYKIKERCLRKATEIWAELLQAA